MNLTIENKNEKITSLELLKQINLFRLEENNKSELRHDNLLQIIRDEFEEEISLLKIQETHYTHPQNKQKYPMFILSIAEAKQVLVRESKYVRKAVIKLLDELVAKTSIPNYSKKELLLLALEQIERIEALEAEQVINAPKLEYHDRVLNSDKLITTTEIAKDLGMSAVKLHLKLNELGIIYKRKKVWMFYSKYEDLIPTHADYRINEFSQVLCWTELGREWILEQIKTL